MSNRTRRNLLANPSPQKLELSLLLETFENGTNQSSLANDNKMLTAMMMVRPTKYMVSFSISKAG